MAKLENQRAELGIGGRAGTKKSHRIPAIEKVEKKKQQSKPLKEILLSSALILLGLVFLIPETNSTAILGQNDEPMHIATVLTSMRKATYMVPTLLDMINYFKPPLLFWEGMISEAILGTSLLAHRFPSILMGIASVVFLYRLLRLLHVSPRQSFLYAYLYLTSLAIMKFSRLLMMEQGMALSMIATAYYFVAYLQKHRTRDLLIAGTISAISFLYKGPLFQIYSGLMLAVWASVSILRFNEKSFQWKGKDSIPEVFKVGVLFHLPMIFPLLWVAFIAYRGHGDFLEYFFVTENFGKFNQQNQPSWRILEGWLEYSMPWTVGLVGGLFYALKQKVRTFRELIGWILIWTAVTVSLLHLLPNRKDPYYVIPVVPLMFAGLALFKPRKQGKLGIGFWNLLFLAVVGTALFFAATWAVFLPEDRLDPAVFAFLGLLPSYAALASWTRSGGRQRYAWYILSGTSWILAMQFALIPGVHRPWVPEFLKARISENLCVVTPQPWDGFSVWSVVPETTVVHSMANSPQRCDQDGKSDVIVLYEPDFKPAPGYKKAASWPLWGQPRLEDINLEKLLHNPALLNQEGRYYVPESRKTK